MPEMKVYLVLTLFTSTKHVYDQFLNEKHIFQSVKLLFFGKFGKSRYLYLLVVGCASEIHL